jgi:hypothetical protein
VHGTLRSSDTDFMVTTSQWIDYIVNLPPADMLNRPSAFQEGFCSCGKYKDYQAPCAHAIACITYLGTDPYAYFYPHYRWEVLKRTYQVPLLPVTLQGLQPLQGHDDVLPPIKRTKRGRPKVTRIRMKYSENTRIYHCSKSQIDSLYQRDIERQSIADAEAITSLPRISATTSPSLVEQFICRRNIQDQVKSIIGMN